MKKQFLNIGIYALTINILLASIGVPLHKRSCRMPDMKETFSLFTPPKTCNEELSREKHTHKKDCCQIPKKESQPINPCCDFSSDLLGVDFVSLDLNEKVFDFDWTQGTLLQTTSFLFALPYSKKQLILYSDSSPPPKPGKYIITLKQSFLI